MKFKFNSILSPIRNLYKWLKNKIYVFKSIFVKIYFLDDDYSYALNCIQKFIYKIPEDLFILKYRWGIKYRLNVIFNSDSQETDKQTSKSQFSVLRKHEAFGIDLSDLLLFLTKNGVKNVNLVLLCMLSDEILKENNALQKNFSHFLDYSLLDSVLRTRKKSLNDWRIVISFVSALLAFFVSIFRIIS